MCGRSASSLPADEMRRLFQIMGELPNVEPSWKIAPSQRAAVVRRHPETGERRLDLLTWSLVPSFTKDLKAARKPINARSETVATSGMFRQALAKRRAIVSADLFYELRAQADGKQPFAIARVGGQPLAFAGLREGWKSPDGEILRTFTILTTEANAEMRAVHDRMPVVLERDAWPTWLGEDERDLVALKAPAPDGTLRLWSVSRDVNSPRHNRPDLVEPVCLPDPPRDEEEASPDSV